MDEDKSRWFRNLFLVPLIVGCILAIATFFLPRLFKDKKEVSYSIEGPTSYLDDPAVGSIAIEVNGAKISNLVAYKVRVWNSGDLPVKALPVRFVFGPKDDLANFKLFSITHNTIPPYEFGKIIDDRSEMNAPRVVYDLLNPKDQDVVTLLANKKLHLEVFSKLEGLLVNRVTLPQEESVWGKYSPVLSAVSGALGALVSTILGFFFARSNATEAKKITSGSSSTR